MTTYYVDSVSGSDGNNGTTTGTPWKTVAKVNSRTFVAGDQILFKAGTTYTGTMLSINQNGSSTNRIVVGAYGTGANPTFDGNNAVIPVSLNGNWITLQDVQVMRAGDPSNERVGVCVFGTDVLIQRVYVTACALGIQVFDGADRCRITASNISDNNVGLLGPDPNDDYGGQGITIKSADGCEIDNNTLNRNLTVLGDWGVNPDYTEDGTAIEVFGATNLLVHHNTADGNQTFCELGLQTTGDCTFHDNLITGSHAYQLGFNIQGDEAEYGPIAGTTRIYNNTINLTGTQTVALWVHHGNTASVHNNIFRDTGTLTDTRSGTFGVKIDEGHNVWYGGTYTDVWAATNAGQGLASTSTIANPLFVSSSDLHLQAGSPAINRGSSNYGYTTDLDGGTRPSSNVDAGVYEYTAAGTPTTVAPTTITDGGTVGQPSLAVPVVTGPGGDGTYGNGMYGAGIYGPAPAVNAFPGTIQDVDTVGSPVLPPMGGPPTPNTITDTGTVGSPQVWPDTVTPTGVTNTETVGAPTVGNIFTVAPDSTTNTETVATSSVSGSFAALIQTLTDDFPASPVDAAKWTTSITGSAGSMSISSSRLRFVGQGVGGTLNLTSVTTNYVLSGSSLFAKITMPPGTDANSLYTMRVKSSYGSGLGEAVVQLCVNGTFAVWGTTSSSGSYTTLAAGTYDTATVLYWRIRAATNNDVYFGYSADGATWTEYGPLNLDWVNQANSRAIFSYAPGSTVGTALLDLVNLNPYTPPTSTPDTVTNTGTVGSPTLVLTQGVTADTITDTTTVGAPQLAPGDVNPATITDTSTVGAPALVANDVAIPTSLANTGFVGNPTATYTATVTPTSVTSTGTVGSPQVASVPNLAPATTSDAGTVGTPSVVLIQVAYGDGVYGADEYIGQTNTLGPDGIHDTDTVGGVTLPGPAPTGVSPDTIADPGTVGAPVMTGTGIAYGTGVYGAGNYAGLSTPPAAPPDGAYGSGPYGDGSYPGSLPNPGGAGTPAPVTGGAAAAGAMYADPMHVVAIGPWNPTKIWRGAPNHRIAAGIAPARPHLLLPGVQSKSFTLRLNDASEATATIQFAGTDAVIVEEMSTDVWWYRKDPHSGALDMIGRFNTSHNDLSRAADGTLQSSLQFQDYRALLGARMIMRYFDVPHSESQWDDNTSVTAIMKFAVPRDMGLDLSALDDPDLLGNTKVAFDLPPSNTIADTFTALQAISGKTWEWWVDTPLDGTKPPKLKFAIGQRGTNRGVTLFDYGTGPSPIASWNMRATSDTYANALYYSGAPAATGTSGGGVVIVDPAGISRYGQRDAQDSDNSVTDKTDSTGKPAALIAAARKRLSTLEDRRPTFTVELRPGFWRGRGHIDIGDTVSMRIRLGKERIEHEYRVSELQVEVDGNGAETVTLTLGNPLPSANPRSRNSPFMKVIRTLRNYEPPPGKTNILDG